MPHRRPHRPLAERQVRRQGAVERSATSGGARSTSRSSRRTSTRCARHRRAPRRARNSSSRICTPAPTRTIACRCASSSELAWQNLFVRNLFIVPPAADLAGFQPQFTVMTAPSFKADPARHGTRSDVGIAVNLASREVLICGTSYAGENKKSIFTVLNYLLPLQRRAVDALLGEHRPGRRHGALLRPVGHRQDDAVERSGSPADRRRRARLERSRRVQLRRRLLREDDPALGRGRAADLRDHPALRHRARERGDGPGDARAESRRCVADREHARRVSDRVHRQRRAVGHRRSSRRTS